jgi:hypothetical protein
MPKFKIGELILVQKAWDTRAIGTVAKVLEYCKMLGDPCPYRVKIEGHRGHTWVDGTHATELLKALI